MRRTVLMQLSNTKTYLTFIMLFQAAGFAIGAFTAADTDGWYQTLERSPLTPPDLAFPIMWTILYIFIAMAGAVLWLHRTEKQGKIAFTIFVVYTALNWSWSFVFFHFHQIQLGYVLIVIMNGINLALIIYCWNKYRKAALLMMPPLLWTCFAAYLNYAIWMLNM